MATKNLKQLMSRFLNFINNPGDKLAGELISPDAIFHIPGRAEPMRGPAGYLAIIRIMRSGFPDIQWRLEDIVTAGDKVAAYFMMRGTHLGTFFGVPATGKSLRVRVIIFYRFSNGKIVEEYGEPDMPVLLKQIGTGYVDEMIHGVQMRL